MFEYIVYKKDECKTCHGRGLTKVAHMAELLFDECEECETKGYIYTEVKLEDALLTLLTRNSINGSYKDTLNDILGLNFQA